MQTINKDSENKESKVSNMQIITKEEHSKMHSLKESNTVKMRDVYSI